MNYRFDIDNYGSSFRVPTSVVSDYIKISDGNFVKVLLCILSGNRVTTSVQLAKKCGLDENTVDDAVIYWTNLGVISVNNTTVAPSVTVDENNNEKAKPVSVVEAVRPKKKVESKYVYKYSNKEIQEKSEKDENFKNLLEEIQKTLQFSINGEETIRLAELYDLYRFDTPSILLVADYCASMGKRSIAYLSTVMIRWFEDEEISTYSEVQKKIIQLNDFHKYENVVLNTFGMTNKPSKQQREYIEKWQSMGITKELLEIAYDKCLNQKGSLSFNYIDGTIKKWTEGGITTPEQVEINDEKFKSRNSYGKEKKSDEKKNSYDLDKIEQFALNFSLYDDEGTEN